jgi:hypothetical protein
MFALNDKELIRVDLAPRATVIPACGAPQKKIHDRR